MAKTAEQWLQWVIDIARAGDMRALSAAVDAADQWLHKDVACSLMSDEAADCAAMVGWAGAGAEEALREVLTR